MSREIETARVPISEIPKENPNIPKVTRNVRGTRILWQLSGNTPEENEWLGIRNVQGLFLEKFPEFNDLFPRGEDGKISERQREEAKGFILGKIQKLDDFYAVIGTSAMNRKATPYFKGSYLLALQKTFVLWGIDINEEDSKKRRRSLERIKQEALTFYQREKHISTKLLQRSRESALLSAIERTYPVRCLN